ncbi:MAG TPA: 16S rRNA (guanine(966)-N(2))-methyltransferase RsmD [Isosphaeraceae bacterium]|nr:16S rRNA (guanine(966)-N(2))-methyltransferase RsmD [Isosphaeraceae bacterium]
MRIIAGLRRGHKLDGPASKWTRPTSDMVRESVFNILGDAVEGVEVFDVFAGTGAMGLEALSRGAQHCVFIERDRSNVPVIRKNVANLRFEDRSAVLSTDAFRWIRSFQPLDDQPKLMILDPPYAEYENHPDRISSALATLVERLPTGSMVVVEAPERLPDDLLPEPDRWDLRRYGSTLVAFRSLARPAPEA